MIHCYTDEDSMAWCKSPLNAHMIRYFCKSLLAGSRLQLVYNVLNESPRRVSESSSSASSKVVDSMWKTSDSSKHEAAMHAFMHMPYMSVFPGIVRVDLVLFRISSELLSCLYVHVSSNPRIWSTKTKIAELPA